VPGGVDGSCQSAICGDQAWAKLVPIALKAAVIVINCNRVREPSRPSSCPPRRPYTSAAASPNPLMTPERLCRQGDLHSVQGQIEQRPCRVLNSCPILRATAVTHGHSRSAFPPGSRRRLGGVLAVRRGGRAGRLRPLPAAIARVRAAHRGRRARPEPTDPASVTEFEMSDRVRFPTTGLFALGGCALRSQWVHVAVERRW
jgi:hypothetical protein